MVGFRVFTRSHLVKVKSGEVAERVYNQLPCPQREKWVIDPDDSFYRDVPVKSENDAVRLLLEKLEDVDTYS